MKRIAIHHGEKRDYTIYELEGTSGGTVYIVDGTDVSGNFKTIQKAIDSIMDIDELPDIDLTAEIRGV